MHSIPKLALTVITSPLTAFKEIIERRLLVPAAWIVAIAGTLAMLSAIARAVTLGPEQLLVIARDNPLTWIGLWMLYALIAWTLIRWLGSEIDYPTVLMAIGWSQVILIVHQALGLVWGILIASGAIHDYEGYAVRFFSAAGTVLPIMYVLAIGRGLQATGRVSFAKGMLVYLIVAAVIVTSLEQWYASKLLAPFSVALPGVYTSAMRLAPNIYAASADPWMQGMAQFVRVTLGGLGLILGIWTLSKFEAWDAPKRNRLLAMTTAVLVIGISAYGYAWNRDTYFPNLLAIQRLYSRGHYTEAARRIDRIIPRLSDSPLLVWGFSNKALLLSDASNLYYLAEQPEESLQECARLLKLAQDHSPNRETERGLSAQAYLEMGMAYDIQGNYSQALAKFNAVAEMYPQSPEPWVRKAVTHDRIGQYKKAIDTANHAIKQLDSNAPIAWVALAQAFVNTGDKKQAMVAIVMVAGVAPELAARFGDKPEGWKDAVSKLTPEDLKFPLEDKSKQAEK